MHGENRAARVAAFRALHQPGDPLLLPNAWDFGSGATLVRAGFRAIGTTSLGVAVANGLPDARGATRAETIAVAQRLAGLACLVTVDIEAGFSDRPADVVALGRVLADAGVVGINIEDGRPGDTLAPVTAQADLIRAVKAAVPDLFINARTDTHWLHPPRPLAQTLTRIAAYREAGADGIFVPGLVDEDNIRLVVAQAGLPVNLLAGRQSVSRLADLGVARVSTGSLLFRAALRAIETTARAIAAGEQPPAGVRSYDEIAALVGQGRIDAIGEPHRSALGLGYAQ